MSRRGRAKAPQTPPKAETVVVGYLSGGFPALEFSASLSALTAYMAANAQADSSFPRLVGALPKKSGPRIAVGRNSLVEHFLATDADWLFMVDDDMQFPADVLDRMLQAAHPQDRPIVGGLAIAGGRDGWFPTITLITQDGVMTRVSDYPPDTLIPVDATGAACLVVHRSVFEKMAQKYERPWQWFQETAYGELAVGEDFTFCLRARASGFPVYIHTGIEFGHCKDVTVTVDWWKEWARSHRVVITGTGRCGTGYLSVLLSALGIDCGHEMVFGPEASGWGNRRGEASWMALPDLERIAELGDLVTKPYVVHLVRNPLHVVNSFMGLGFFDDEPDAVHHPYIPYAGDPVGATPLERACRFVVDWNRRCEAVADQRIHVDRLTGEDLVPVVRAAGAFHQALEIDQKIAAAPTNINHRPRASFLWDDMTDELRTLAVEYGYPIEE